MYVDSDLPGETVQGKVTAFPIANRPPMTSTGRVEREAACTRGQPFDAAGRRGDRKSIKRFRTFLVGAWPDEDRRWRLLRNYYYNCIRDCDSQVVSVLDSLKSNGMDKTPSSFSPLTMANSVAIIDARRATAPTDNRTICH